MARKKKTQGQLEHAALNRKLKQYTKKMNQRIGALKRENERFGVTNDPVLEEFLDAYRDLTKTKSKTKLATGNLSRMSRKTKEDIVAHYEKYLIRSRAAGTHWRHFNTAERAKMRRRSIDTLNARYFQGTAVLNNRNWWILQNLFNSRELSEWQSNNLLDSSQVLQLAGAMSEGQYARLGDALETIGKMFNSTKEMQNVWKQDSDAFRNLLWALTIPDNQTRTEALKDNEVYQAYKDRL